MREEEREREEEEEEREREEEEEERERKKRRRRERRDYVGQNLKRKRTLSEIPTLFGCSENGSRELWVRFSCLCCYHNIGTILSCPQSNGLANTTASSRDEQSASC